MIRVIVFFLLFISAELTAEYYDTATRIYLETKNGYQLDELRFGINDEASFSLDTLLGESELPPFPPPEGIHAGFEFIDTNQNERIISYLDLKPYPINDGDTVEYVLQTFKGAGDVLTIKWNPLGPELQSAYIVDIITRGKLVKINMKDSSEARIDNEFIERFIFQIVYNPNTSVGEEEVIASETSEFFVSPVEFTDRVTIKCDMRYNRYEIYNLFGSKAAYGSIEYGHSEINLNAAAPGIYFVAIYDNSGNRVVKKIVKA